MSYQNTMWMQFNVLPRMVGAVLGDVAVQPEFSFGLYVALMREFLFS